MEWNRPPYAVPAIKAIAWEVSGDPPRLIVFNDDGTVKEEITDPAEAKKFFKSLGKKRKI